MSDVKALIAEAQHRASEWRLVYGEPNYPENLALALSLADALESATRPALVVESREELANILAHAGTDWELAMSNGEKTQPLADHLTTELLDSGVVRLAADVVREAKAEAWDEGVVALARRKDWHWPVNPYRTEGESR